MVVWCVFYSRVVRRCTRRMARQRPRVLRTCRTLSTSLQHHLHTTTITPAWDQSPDHIIFIIHQWCTGRRALRPALSHLLLPVWHTITTSVTATATTAMDQLVSSVLLLVITVVNHQCNSHGHHGHGPAGEYRSVVSDNRSENCHQWKQNDSLTVTVTMT